MKDKWKRDKLMDTPEQMHYDKTNVVWNWTQYCVQ